MVTSDESRRRNCTPSRRFAIAIARGPSSWSGIDRVFPRQAQFSTWSGMLQYAFTETLPGVSVRRCLAGVPPPLSTASPATYRSPQPRRVGRIISARSVRQNALLPPKTPRPHNCSSTAIMPHDPEHLAYAAALVRITMRQHSAARASVRARRARRARGRLGIRRCGFGSRRARSRPCNRTPVDLAVQAQRIEPRDRIGWRPRSERSRISRCHPNSVSGMPPRRAGRGSAIV